MDILSIIAREVLGMRKTFAVLIMILTCAICIFPTGASAAMRDEEFLKLCESGSVQEIEAAIKNGENVNAREALNKISCGIV